MLITTRTYDIYDFYRTRSYRLQSNTGFTFERALTAFTRSDNSAESEPIWIKSRALWVHCLVLAIGDFCRDPRSSEGWRARRNFFCQESNARFHWFPVSQISRNSNNALISVAMNPLGTELWKFSRRNRFSKKMQNNEFFSTSCDFKLLQWL